MIIPVIEKLIYNKAVIIIQRMSKKQLKKDLKQSNLYVNNQIPVSYTHLDVYKRQMLRTLNRAINRIM